MEFRSYHANSSYTQIWCDEFACASPYLSVPYLFVPTLDEKSDDGGRSLFIAS